MLSKILILEDNELFVEVLIEAMNRMVETEMNFEVHSSIEGFLSAGKDKNRFYDFDVAFVDYKLKGTDGTDLFELFQDYDHYPLTVFMTGFDMIENFFPSDKIYTVQKPFNFEETIRTVFNQS